MNDHPVIWLQPGCEDCEEDRQWCSENAWHEGCDECGAMPVKYVLASDQPKRTEQEK